MSGGEKPRHYKFYVLSDVAQDWLERNPYAQGFEREVSAAIAGGLVMDVFGCEGGFGVRFSRMRRSVVMRITVCLREDEYTFLVRWFHDERVR